MEFELFITKWKNMYIIFEEEGEPMEEEAKTRFIIKRVEKSDLHKSIESFKDQTETNRSGTVSYTTEANHLSTSIS